MADGTHPTTPLASEIAGRTKAEAEVERLRDGIRAVIAGDYPRVGRVIYRADGGDTCDHGRPYWDECGRCAEAALKNLIERGADDPEARHG